MLDVSNLAAIIRLSLKIAEKRRCIHYGHTYPGESMISLITEDRQNLNLIIEELDFEAALADKVHYP